ncbi:MAG TPA: sugar nucleotide-binding protein, partial [bacterium]|nr:sugar nucleotide-binding protein [bacterium]
MNILLTGANGMLGKSIEYWIFKNFPNVKLYSTDIKNLDITNYEQLSIFFDNHPIDIVINCAAYANVDGCEQNPEIAYSVNAAAVGYLAKLTEKYSKKICHISTDYVYAQIGENMPFTEESKLEPLSIYGKS